MPHYPLLRRGEVPLLAAPLLFSGCFSTEMVDAGDLWRVACEDWFFHSKMPASFGPFFKDIIAGHVGTYHFCGENRVYWDGEAHFYLDGSTETSGVVPVLKYDSATNRYTTFERFETPDGDTRWVETVVRPG